MQWQRYFLVLLTTPLLVALTGRSGFAFSFNLPSLQPDSPCTSNSFYCSSESYTDSNFGTVTTTLKSVSTLPLGGTDAFFNLLTSSVWAKNPDKPWMFQKAKQGQDLKGSFDIKVYKPYAQRSPYDSVGADIQILYKPSSTDPQGSNVHWIQRVVSNHALITYADGNQELKPYGTQEDKIDVVEEQKNPKFVDPQRQTFTPYYDTFSSYANSNSFEDFPTRPNITDSHDWSAELYLLPSRYKIRQSWERER